MQRACCAMLSRAMPRCHSFPIYLSCSVGKYSSVGACTVDNMTVFECGYRLRLAGLGNANRDTPPLMPHTRTRASSSPKQPQQQQSTGSPIVALPMNPAVRNGCTRISLRRIEWLTCGSSVHVAGVFEELGGAPQGRMGVPFRSLAATAANLSM